MRKQQHRRDAGRYKHKFARAIKKYGIDVFAFNILEESDDADWLLHTREPFWINLLNTTNDECGYNTCIGGRGRVGCTPWNKGIPHSDASREKMRQSTLGHQQSPETVIKRQKKLLGQKRSSETKNRMASTWEITHPDGSVAVVKNLQEYCRMNGLTAPCMIAVANGVRAHHKNHKCQRVEIGPQSRRQSPT